MRLNTAGLLTPSRSSLVENPQRKDLTAFAEADGLRPLADNFGYTHEAMAEKLGVTIDEAQDAVLSYIRSQCPDGSRPPLAGNSVATDRASVFTRTSA